MFGWIKIGKGKATKSKKTGFYYDKNGVFKKGVLPEKVYYNDKLGAMVEGVAGYAASKGSALSLGGQSGTLTTPGKEGHSAFSDPFSEDGFTYGKGGVKIMNSTKKYLQTLLDEGRYGELAAAALTAENRSK